MYTDVKILNPLPRVIYKIHASIKYNVHVNYTAKRVNSMIMSTKLKLSYFRWNSSLSIYDLRFLARFILESLHGYERWCFETVDMTCMPMIIEI